MVISDIGKHIAIGEELILYSKTNLNYECDLKIRYKINIEDKEIRLYDVPRILTFEEKVIIYFAILDRYFFLPFSKFFNLYKEEGIEEYIVKENGYSYHEFNQIPGENKGILAELLFEIPRQENEPEKVSRIRDIHDMLVRNVQEIGKRPICISFNGTTDDFKDVIRVIEYMFENDEILKEKNEKCKRLHAYGFLRKNKRIYIVPN